LPPKFFKLSKILFKNPVSEAKSPTTINKLGYLLSKKKPSAQKKKNQRTQKSSIVNLLPITPIPNSSNSLCSESFIAFTKAFVMPWAFFA
jgi:hypothetical protein